MDSLYPKKNLIAHKKVLPALGGINKGYLRKAKCLKSTLNYLVRNLKVIKKRANMEEKDKIILDEILDDIIEISKYEKFKTFDFYLTCSSIVKKYNC